jgi:hypothetical protein
MRVVVESNTGIRVAELPLRDFGSGTRLKENCGMHVPEGMKVRIQDDADQRSGLMPIT